MEKHDHELEGLDVEALLNYAEFMAENPARLWQEASPDQKRRLQTFLVPTGVTWDRELEPAQPACSSTGYALIPNRLGSW